MPTNTDPEFVKLAERLTTGMLADVHGSLWSISGYDVKRFPEGEVAARFVRENLNAGKLEEADQEEWDEVHSGELEAAVLGVHPDYRQTASAFQEAHLQQAAVKTRAQLERNRAARARGEDPEEARQADLARRLEEQEEAGIDSDDPEEQKALSTRQKVKKKTNKSR